MRYNSSAIHLYSIWSTLEKTIIIIIVVYGMK